MLRDDKWQFEKIGENQTKMQHALHSDTDISLGFATHLAKQNPPA